MPNLREQQAASTARKSSSGRFPVDRHPSFGHALPDLPSPNRRVVTRRYAVLGTKPCQNRDCPSSVPHIVFSGKITVKSARLQHLGRR